MLGEGHLWCSTRQMWSPPSWAASQTFHFALSLTSWVIGAIHLTLPGFWVPVENLPSLPGMSQNELRALVKGEHSPWGSPPRGCLHAVMPAVLCWSLACSGEPRVDSLPSRAHILMLQMLLLAHRLGDLGESRPCGEDPSGKGLGHHTPLCLPLCEPWNHQQEGASSRSQPRGRRLEPLCCPLWASSTAWLVDRSLFRSLYRPPWGVEWALPLLMIVHLVDFTVLHPTITTPLGGEWRAWLFFMVFTSSKAAYPKGFHFAGPPSSFSLEWGFLVCVCV